MDSMAARARAPRLPRALGMEWLLGGGDRAAAPAPARAFEAHNVRALCRALAAVYLYFVASASMGGCSYSEPCLRARTPGRWLGGAGPIHASAAAVGLPVNSRVALLLHRASLGQTRIFDVLASEPCSSRARAAERVDGSLLASVLLDASPRGIKLSAFKNAAGHGNRLNDW